MKCSICGKEIQKDPMTGWEEGNNAQPVNDGRCCNECNINIVIPRRLREINRKIYK